MPEEQFQKVANKNSLKEGDLLKMKTKENELCYLWLEEKYIL
jgi:hypothetical protein